MSNTVIKIENLSKIYRLGEIGTGTLSHDLNRWWAMNIRGKEDPYATIGGVNDRTAKARKGEHIAALKDISLEVMHQKTNHARFVRNTTITIFASIR